MINGKGFTLVEIIAAMTIGMIMLMAIHAAVNTAQISSSGTKRKVIAQQDVRSVLELMAMEIRMASYSRDINMKDIIWRNPADCCSASLNPAYRGIQEAGPFHITIEMDINDNGLIDKSSENDNETIKYAYDADEQYITRSTNCGNAQPLLGDKIDGHKAVRVMNDQNGDKAAVYNKDSKNDVPVFRYFNGKGEEIYPGTDSTEIPNIRTIEITLVVHTEYIDPMTKKPQTMVYSTRVIPRNHAIVMQ